MANIIRETFGENIVVDGVVDRKALGRIVFGNKVHSIFFSFLLKKFKNEFQEKLDSLNNIVWPSLKEKVKEIIINSKAEFIVVDAAILLKAGWNSNSNLVHQVWSCIVPPEEAIKRLNERDGISNEQVRFSVFHRIFYHWNFKIMITINAKY